jgi:hypothetical protein
VTRTVRIAIAVGVLAIFQIAAYRVYRAVERSRAPRAVSRPRNRSPANGPEAARGARERSTAR